MTRFGFLLGVVLACGPGARAEEPLVAHEWGTFTSLQDEDGEALGGINTDDEPVPQFVHRIADGLLISPSEAPPRFFQGAPSCHPDVTMRLETPVIYFHPPAGWRARPVEVDVKFQGGWLTEFYPNALSTAPGLDKRGAKFGHISSGTFGELSWKGLTIGGEGQGPETQEKVWLAPRAVDSAMVKTDSGEREKFLFYRGVAHAHAWVSLLQEVALKKLKAVIHYDGALGGDMGDTPRVHAAWLVEVNQNGECAFFRSVKPEEWKGRGTDYHAWMPAGFATDDFKAANLPELQDQMRNALIKEGLFAGEAEALLRTWGVSYFKSPGLRFFYICPGDEVACLLPLKVSVPSKITRVMMGRIEIVTPEQRTLLRKIAAGPAPDLSLMRGATDESRAEFFRRPETVAHWSAVLSGKAPYSALGLPIPELYRDYLKLGRFRNALILDEEKRRPTAALQQFITENGFEGYKVP